MMTEPGSRLDLDDATRRALEFDELLGWLARYARTPMGVQRVRSLLPIADPAAVQERLEAVDQFRRVLDEHGTVVPTGLPDPREAIRALGVEGVVLDGKVCRDLAIVLRASWEVADCLRALPAGVYPQLTPLCMVISDLRNECADVLSGTDAEGRLLDDASPELRRLRGRMTHIGERLRRMLETHLKEPGAESVIRDDFVTRRNGRFVIPVRVDAPRPVRGIVHARSSSGATNFVEPLETVELNNELVSLADEERDEQQRILGGWTNGFRLRLDEARTAIATLARADSLQARALFADAWGATTPRVGSGSPLHLHELRHPLLQRRLSDEGGECVPASFELDPADRVLVLSGPNTGGKTVALKSVGLAALMAQSGIPVTATTAQLPAYRQIRADIGDHQSIQADLSTYSAHVRAVAEAIRHPTPPALFLFDEIGTGTEPGEGAALARAVLESLARPGITTVATTHLSPVKAWAVTADAAVCAAMDLDPDTLLPNYRVVMGAAGRSAGLDIAARLGLDTPVVERARELLDPRLREGEDYLRRLRSVLRDAETEAEQLRLERADLVRARDEFRTRSEREMVARGREADRALDRALETFRAEARKQLAALHDPHEKRRAERRAQRATQRLRTERIRQGSGLGSVPDQARAGGAPLTREELAPGVRVWVSSLGREGEIQEVRERGVDVRLGGVVFRTHLADLLAATAVNRPETAAAPAADRTPVARVRDSPRELHLIGRRVDDALEELDRFLDGARVAGHAEVRVVHGHGTGRLRAAVRGFLDDHDLVRSHRPGRGAEGGDGVTVARLD